MTILAPSLITPTTSKLLSYLSFNSSHNNDVKPQTSDITTYITIVMKKDGTPTTKYLNSPVAVPPNKLLSRRRRSSSSLLNISSPPKQRRLTISSLIPRLYTLSKRHSQQDLGRLVNDQTIQIIKNTADSTYLKSQSLDCLPLELAIKIILNLDHASLLNLSRANKQFYRLCHQQHDRVWQYRFRTDYSIYMDTRQYYDLYKNHFELGKRWKSGKVKTRYLTGHHDSVYCLVWVGNRVLSGSRDRSIKLWDLEADTPLVLTKTHHDGSVLCLRVAQDQSFFVTGSSDTTCLVWSLPDYTPQMRLVGHSSGVLDICIVNSQYIVSSSRDATIRVWDKDTGSELRRLTGHAGPVNALGAFGDQVVSASGDTTLKLWDVVTGQCLKTFAGHTRGLACVRFDGRYIYSGGQDNKLKVWDSETGQCLSTLAGHTDLIRTIDSFENMVVSGSYDRTLRVWDRKENKCLLSFQSGHSSWIFNCLLNRTKIISAGQDKRIMVLDFGYNLKTIDS